NSPTSSDTGQIAAPPVVRGAPGAHLRNACLVVALATLIRVVVLAISDLNLDGDEAQYWSWSLELAPGYFTKPPLIAWLIRAGTSLFGDAEFGLRVVSPLLHATTAMVLFAVGREAFDPCVGFWSAALFITLPGISFSSLLITTDVPLLLAWSVALWCYLRLLERRHIGYALMLGVAVGTGLLAKYAMGYFIACAVLAGVALPRVRWVVTSWHGGLALILALAMLVPNFLWNAANGFATLSHTADNASWNQPFNNPLRALEFVGGQLGVFGPVSFAMLLAMGWAWARRRLTEKENLLLFFVIPILVVLTLQGLISRAHANWAATAYVAATPALVAWLVRLDRAKMLAEFVGWHGAVAVAGYLFVVALALWPSVPGAHYVARLRGWDTLGAQITERNTDRRPIMADARQMMAEIIYYTRGKSNSYVMWDANKRLEHHYELTIPYVSGSVFLVTGYPNTRHITRCFAAVGSQAEVTIDTGASTKRLVFMQTLDDFKGC
ncbi:MAG: ArnT family glycosyltransferase, partial [Alphaproteobacteria bacterium]